VTVPELELGLKEFILTYQDKAILSEAILIEKAKLLAVGLEVLLGGSRNLKSVMESVNNGFTGKRHQSI